MSKSALAQFNQEFVALIDRARHSTAMVTGMTIDLAAGGSGSAWVYDDQGHLVTNYHVVADLKRNLRVHFAGKPPMPAQIVGVDPGCDLAVLRTIEPVVLTALPVRTALPALGELCVAMGAPLRFSESVSFGIVSGLHRQIPVAETTIEEIIQTDAAINPGNSGGPLIDIAGHVIGVNIAKRGDADNIGFAICGEVVADVVPELITYGDVKRGTFGLTVGEELDPHGGEDPLIVVQRVRVEPSLFAVGDVIAHINHSPVRRRYDVRKALHRQAIGQQLCVGVLRAGVAIELHVPVLPRT